MIVLHGNGTWADMESTLDLRLLIGSFAEPNRKRLQVYVIVFLEKNLSLPMRPYTTRQRCDLVPRDWQQTIEMSIYL